MFGTLTSAESNSWSPQSDPSRVVTTADRTVPALSSLLDVLRSPYVEVSSLSRAALEYTTLTGLAFQPPSKLHIKPKAIPSQAELFPDDNLSPLEDAIVSRRSGPATASHGALLASTAFSLTGEFKAAVKHTSAALCSPLTSDTASSLASLLSLPSLDLSRAALVFPLRALDALAREDALAAQADDEPILSASLAARWTRIQALADQSSLARPRPVQQPSADAALSASSTASMHAHVAIASQAARALEGAVRGVVEAQERERAADRSVDACVAEQGRVERDVEVVRTTKGEREGAAALTALRAGLTKLRARERALRAQREAEEARVQQLLGDASTLARCGHDAAAEGVTALVRGQAAACASVCGAWEHWAEQEEERSAEEELGGVGASPSATHTEDVARGHSVGAHVAPLRTLVGWLRAAVSRMQRDLEGEDEGEGEGGGGSSDGNTANTTSGGEAGAAVDVCLRAVCAYVEVLSLTHVLATRRLARAATDTVREPVPLLSPHPLLVPLLLLLATVHSHRGRAGAADAVTACAAALVLVRWAEAPGTLCATPHAPLRSLFDLLHLGPHAPSPLARYLLPLYSTLSRCLRAALDALPLADDAPPGTTGAAASTAATPPLADSAAAADASPYSLLPALASSHRLLHAAAAHASPSPSPASAAPPLPPAEVTHDLLLLLALSSHRALEWLAVCAHVCRNAPPPPRTDLSGLGASVGVGAAGAGAGLAASLTSHDADDVPAAPQPYAECTRVWAAVRYVYTAAHDARGIFGNTYFPEKYSFPGKEFFPNPDPRSGGVEDGLAPLSAGACLSAWVSEMDAHAHAHGDEGIEGSSARHTPRVTFAQEPAAPGMTARPDTDLSLAACVLRLLADAVHAHLRLAHHYSRHHNIVFLPFPRTGGLCVWPYADYQAHHQRGARQLPPPPPLHVPLLPAALPCTPALLTATRAPARTPLAVLWAQTLHLAATAQAMGAALALATGACRSLPEGGNLFTSPLNRYRFSDAALLGLASADNAPPRVESSAGGAGGAAAVGVDVGGTVLAKHAAQTAHTAHGSATQEAARAPVDDAFVDAAARIARSLAQERDHASADTHADGQSILPPPSPAAAPAALVASRVLSACVRLPLCEDDVLLSLLYGPAPTDCAHAPLSPLWSVPLARLTWHRALAFLRRHAAALAHSLAHTTRPATLASPAAWASLPLHALALPHTVPLVTLLAPSFPAAPHLLARTALVHTHAHAASASAASPLELPLALMSSAAPARAHECVLSGVLAAALYTHTPAPLAQPPSPSPGLPARPHAAVVDCSLLPLAPAPPRARQRMLFAHAGSQPSLYLLGALPAAELLVGAHTAMQHVAMLHRAVPIPALASAQPLHSLHTALLAQWRASDKLLLELVARTGRHAATVATSCLAHARAAALGPSYSADAVRAWLCTSRHASAARMHTYARALAQSAVVVARAVRGTASSVFVDAANAVTAAEAAAASDTRGGARGEGHTARSAAKTPRHEGAARLSGLGALPVAHSSQLSSRVGAAVAQEQHRQEQARQWKPNARRPQRSAHLGMAAAAARLSEQFSAPTPMPARSHTPVAQTPTAGSSRPRRIARSRSRARHADASAPPSPSRAPAPTRTPAASAGDAVDDVDDGLPRSVPTPVSRPTRAYTPVHSTAAPVATPLKRAAERTEVGVSEVSATRVEVAVAVDAGDAPSYTAVTHHVPHHVAHSTDAPSPDAPILPASAAACALPRPDAAEWDDGAFDVFAD